MIYKHQYELTFIKCTLTSVQHFIISVASWPHYQEWAPMDPVDPMDVANVSEKYALPRVNVTLPEFTGKLAAMHFCLLE